MRMRSSKQKAWPLFHVFLFISIVCLCPVSAKAQDAHYWTHQYGTRATLLGGAVVGSVLDLSGTYYNPGVLSLIEDPDTFIAAKVFQYPRITLEDFGKKDNNLNTSTVGPAPTLVAGRLKFKGLGKHWLGYSILTRQEVNFDLAGSFSTQLDLSPVPGLEALVGDVRLDEKLIESWVGLTWAYKVKKNIGIGVSQYLMVRSHRANFQLLAETLYSSGEIALAMGARKYYYLNWRLLWKLGAAFDFERITMGITLTTPSFKLYGAGSTGMNTTGVAWNIGNGAKGDFLAADYQEGLNASFKTPISLALGSTLKLKNVCLYGTVEWFSPMGKYEVISGEDFTAQSTGQKLSNKITQELDSVLNFGVGVEYVFGPRLRGYGSFTSDYSARRPGTDTNLTVSDWDIFHLMAGADFGIKKAAFTLGLGYSFGSRKAGAAIEKSLLKAEGELLASLTELDYRYSSFKLVLGFSF
jgi:long-subunit fatty acid transport protein